MNVPRFINQVQEEGLANTSKSLLGTMARGAGNLVGLETNYEERETEESNQIAFEASIGRFKFRRVKNK